MRRIGLKQSNGLIGTSETSHQIRLAKSCALDILAITYCSGGL